MFGIGPGARDVMDRRRPTLSLIAWAFDEEECVEVFVRTAHAALAAVADDYEVIVVDDGSRDRTAAILDRLRPEFPELRVLTHPENRNVISSFHTALRMATKEYVFCNTVDMSFDMSGLARFVALLDPRRVVVGLRRSRFDNYPLWRVIISLGNTLQANLVLGLRLRDVQAIQFYPRDFLQGIQAQLACRSPVLASEMLYRALAAGLDVVHIPCVYLPRKSGRSKLRPYLRALSGCLGDLVRLVWRFRVLGESPLHRRRGRILRGEEGSAGSP